MLEYSDNSISILEQFKALRADPTRLTLVISQMPESLERRILELRYLEKLNWYEVSKALNYQKSRLFEILQYAKYAAIIQHNLTAKTP